MAFTTARLLNQIKLKGSLPTGRYEDSEILDVAYDVLISEITPILIGYREEYYVRYTDVTIEASKSTYNFPSRSMGQTLREVKIVYSDGSVKKLDRIEIEDIATTDTGEPCSFYIMGNNICLYPTPSTQAGTLRQYYHIRPSKLVTVTEAAQITEIDTGTNTLTFSSLPSTFLDSETYDLIENTGGYDVLSLDLSASSVTSTTVVLSSLPTGLAVGDWLALSDESPIPYLLQEAHSLLVQLSVAALLEYQGDRDNHGLAMQRAGMIRNTLENILKLRVEGSPKSLTTPLH